MMASWLWFTMEIWSEERCTPVGLLLFRDVRGWVECSGYHFTNVRAMGVLFGAMGVVALAAAGVRAMVLTGLLNKSLPVTPETAGRCRGN